MKTAIEIQGAKYPIKFGYGVLKALGRKWKCKGINGVYTKIGEIFNDEGIVFDKEAEFRDLLIAGVEKATPGKGEELEKMDPDDLMEAMVFSGENLEIFMEAFQEITPTNSGNPMPRREVRKKKRAAAKK